MKKLILSLVLILSFAFSKAQKIDSVYNADSVEYIKDIDHPVSVGKKIAVQIVFNQNLNVVFNFKDTAILFLLDVPATTEQVAPGVVIRTYMGYVSGVSYILATRTDNGVLYSVGISDYRSLSIYYIKPPEAFL